MSSLIAAKKLLMASASGTKATYVNDYFSNDLYTGTGTMSGSSDSGAKTITNSIDYSEGALTWIKQRSHADSHQLYDTVRGDNKRIYSNSGDAENTANGDRWGLKFNSNGYTLGNAADGINVDTRTYAGWTFRKQKGFFDVVTWTGNGSDPRNISHSLGSVPGCILYKRLDTTSDWVVYHCSLTNPATYMLQLDGDIAEYGAHGDFGSTLPTADVITVAGNLNVSSATYVAYLFAGSNATRWSDMISPASGTFDFPAERAFNGLLEGHPNRLRTSGNAVLCTMTISPAITIQAGQSVVVYGEDAAVGNPYGYSGTATVTIDGTTYTSSTGDTHTFNHSGQLTQITYVNNSSTGRTYLEGIRVNGDLLTDGSFFVNGNPNYTTGAESKFGEEGDQSIVKCGKYIGNGNNTTSPDVYLGWEPQWVIVKRISGAGTDWVMVDSMRGMPTDQISSEHLRANATNAENDAAYYRINRFSKGFKPTTTDNGLNADGDTYIYIALRFPDGYVGKPAEVGTDVFAMDTGNGSSTIPAFDSGFPVDFGLTKNPTSGGDWYTVARLLGGNHLVNSGNNAISNSNWTKWDSNVGEGVSWSSAYQSWMWKRGPGFDTVTYTGGGSGDTIPHNLNAVPEMMWVKNTSAAQSWAVYHKGLNGGTNPEQYYQMLNSALGTGSLGTASNRWNDTAPTSTHFSVGGSNNTGNGGDAYIAMLFASANDEEGNPISKVGYYTGDNSSDGSKVITTGFEPRFIIIKSSSNEENWIVLDTLRGISTSGNDKNLNLNNNDAQSNSDAVDLSATGFSLRSGSGHINANGYQYIYYAHA